MAQYKSISQYLKRLKKVLKSSEKAAVKKALTAGRTVYSKNVGADTGLTAAKLKGRTRYEKSSGAEYQNTLSVGTKFPVPAHDFKVGQVKTQSTRGIRYTATYQMKSGNKTELPGSFVVKGKNSKKKVIVHRDGQARYPTKTTLTHIKLFTDAVTKHMGSIRKAMVESLQKNFLDQFKYRSSK